MSRPPLTFVVGTGRCGSTAVSRVLRLHPSVLSLSELFTTLEPGALPEQDLDGEEFWEILASSRPFADRMIRDGTPVPEHLYPRSPGRFTGAGGVPALCLTTLPHLTSDPDVLFDALRPVLTARPAGPAAGHYRALFAELSARCGGHAVVERSGFSLSLAPRLRQHFPEARFVHLYRAGPDCALSMSRHPGFQLIEFLADATHGSGPEAPAKLERMLADDSFDLTGALKRPVPVARYGALWSRMITEGLSHLDALPPGTVMPLAFEDLLEAPEHQLTRLAGHIGVEPDPEWLAAAGGVLDGGRRGTSDVLPPSQREALLTACTPGTRALAARARRTQAGPGRGGRS
ncbi:sulfotransferase family protein [Streptomyces sp. NBC_01187]|uniref:sulfotransferase family protein n=1 Tax=Streptomyces sp. NBC_01187 TaxID=2903766 RepID=UPI00386FEA69|nr:sulfotransferase [Streptomyces sp. NBC_01187]